MRDPKQKCEGIGRGWTGLIPGELSECPRCGRWLVVIANGYKAFTPGAGKRWWDRVGKVKVRFPPHYKECPPAKRGLWRRQGRL